MKALPSPEIHMRRNSMLSQRDSVMFHLQQKRHGHVDCLVASGILLSSTEYLVPE